MKKKRLLLILSFIMSCFMLFTSCEKDDELVSYYGDSKKSYVKTCDKKIKGEVTRCVRNAYGNVLLSFSLSTTRLSNTYVSIDS